MTHTTTQLPQVSEDKLRETLEQAYNHANDFDWSGWRLPIFLSDDGELSIGDWMSVGSWQPGVLEITSVERWTLTELWPDFEGEISEDDIEAAIDEMVDFHIKQLEEDFEPNFEIVQ